LGVLCWLIYGVHIGDEAIIVANAITLMLAGIILSYKIYNTIFRKS
jgi:MtN3 and saliva related transmembrane protein